MKAHSDVRIERPSESHGRIVEAVSVLGLILYAGVIYHYWSMLPDEIPVHYGIAGEPDRYGGKDSLIWLYVICVFLYGMLTALRFIPPSWMKYNYPPVRNPERELPVVRRMLSWLKLEMVAIFLYIGWMTCKIALGEADGIGTLFMPILLVIVFGTVGIFIVRLFKLRRTE